MPSSTPEMTAHFSAGDSNATEAPNPHWRGFLCLFLTTNRPKSPTAKDIQCLQHITGATQCSLERFCHLFEQLCPPQAGRHIELKQASDWDVVLFAWFVANQRRQPTAMDVVWLQGITGASENDLATRFASFMSSQVPGSSAISNTTLMLSECSEAQGSVPTSTVTTSYKGRGMQSPVIGNSGNIKENR